MALRHKGIIRNRGTSWQVDFPTTRPRYRKSWPTEAEAIRDMARKERQLAGVGLADHVQRSCESAYHRLSTCEGPCRGKTIDDAVDFYLIHFKGDDTSLTLTEYGTDYKVLKEQTVEAKSYTEVRLHIDDFLAEFGHMKPHAIQKVQLQGYLASRSSRHYREKSLSAFFAWLSGQSKAKGLVPLETPPLQTNPFRFIARTRYTKLRPTEILTAAEFKALILEADNLGILPWIVWCGYTGMRPDAEAVPFWTLPEHGWNQIDLDRGLVCVTDDLEKTGARIRDITIQPNFKEWLEWMKSTGQQPCYSRRKLRKLFDRVLPNRNHKDILRHTWISFSLKIMTEDDVCYEGATSGRIIKKHYRRQVPKPDVDLFWGFTPKSLGLV